MSACPAKAQENESAASRNLDLHFSGGLRKKGSQLRIRNRRTGKETVLSLDDRNFLASEEAQRILSGPVLHDDPLEFSIRYAQPGRIEARQNQSASAVVNEKLWRPLTYRIQRMERGAVFRLDTGAPETIEVEKVRVSKANDVDKARDRGGLRENEIVRKLFEIGWKAILTKRHDVAEEAFNRLIRASAKLNPEQKAQAHLGLGITYFHQKGCAAARPELDIAATDPKNEDDVHYFTALCLVNDGKHARAEKYFLDLSKRSHPQYGEPSRLYLGVVSEALNKNNEAQNFYMDTIDFATDAQLVAIAKQRLSDMQARESRGSNSWFTGSASLGGGYDSNVVTLPQSLAPADYNLSKVNAFSSLLMAGVDARVIARKSFENHLRYNFLVMHYLDGSLSAGNDIQSHEINTSFDFAAGASQFLSLVGAYSSVFKGVLGSAAEYIASPSVELKWARNSESRQYLASLRYERINPKQAYESADKDLTANGYKLSTRYLREYKKGSSWGPGLDLEYHPSAGIENSYYSATLLGLWSHPAFWKFSLSHEAALQYSPYYQSALSRKDLVLRYRAGLSRPLGRRLDLAMQLAGFLNLSTDKANYQYNRYQFNLLLTAPF